MKTLNLHATDMLQLSPARAWKAANVPMDYALQRPNRTLATRLIEAAMKSRISAPLSTISTVAAEDFHG